MPKYKEVTCSGACGGEARPACGLCGRPLHEALVCVRRHWVAHTEDELLAFMKRMIYGGPWWAA
jgi:hypothetical protein